ncbi:MAG TPA: hypothetical protein VI603_05790 [Saprospiraceae bacterium]|nr:hypothetical protein [Saprospiraceae bacterium]
MRFAICLVISVCANNFVDAQRYVSVTPTLSGLLVLAKGRYDDLRDDKLVPKQGIGTLGLNIESAEKGKISGGIHAMFDTHWQHDYGRIGVYYAVFANIPGLDPRSPMFRWHLGYFGWNGRHGAYAMLEPNLISFPGRRIEFHAGIDIAYYYVLKEVDVQIMNTTRRGGFMTYGPNIKLLVYLSKDGSPYKVKTLKKSK